MHTHEHCRAPLMWYSSAMGRSEMNSGLHPLAFVWSRSVTILVPVTHFTQSGNADNSIPFQEDYKDCYGSLTLVECSSHAGHCSKPFSPITSLAESILGYIQVRSWKGQCLKTRSSWVPESMPPHCTLLPLWLKMTGPKQHLFDHHHDR
jgi:hypothetical protein